MTNPPLNPVIDRREFLRGGARFVLTAAMAAFTVRTVVRGGVRLSGQTCIGEGICPRCRNSSECGLPQALSFREAKKARIAPASKSPIA